MTVLYIKLFLIFILFTTWLGISYYPKFKADERLITFIQITLTGLISDFLTHNQTGTF